MIRKLVVLLSMFLLSLPLFSGVESYLRLAAEWSYDTNAFSSPLPTGFSLDSYFPNGGEFLKRQNIGFSISSDTYFVDESRVGLSLSFAFRAPYHSVSIIPEGSGYDWIYREEDSTDRQHSSLFAGIGPVFRYSFGSVELSLPIRLSLGSYDFFSSGFIAGVSIEPGVNVFLGDDIFLSFSLVYDAHLMKFFFSLDRIYDPGYIMLTAGVSLGAGFRFGGDDA